VQPCALRPVVGTVGRRVADRLVLDRIAYDAADLLALLEDDEHSDEKEHVRVMGAVDWEFAGVVPLRMVAGLPHFLLCSLSALPDSSNDEQHDVGGSGDGVRPVWVDAMDSHSRGSVLPRAARDDDRLARVWGGTLREGEDGDDDNDDEAWARGEFVPAAQRAANVEWHEVQRACVGPGIPHIAPSSPATLGLNIEVVKLGRVSAERARRRPLRREVLTSGHSRTMGETGETLATVESAMPATPAGPPSRFPRPLRPLRLLLPSPSGALPRCSFVLA
jgi:hypothetical protein